MRATAAAVCVLTFAAGQAYAGKIDEGEHDLGGWYVPYGIHLGASLHERAANGWLIGGEVSVVRVHGMLAESWAGGYADVRWDSGLEGLRLSIGPEAGLSILGADAGLLFDYDGDRLSVGGTARLLLTIGLAGVYVRGNYVLEPDGWSVDFGVLLKIPNRRTRDVPLECAGPGCPNFP